MTRTKSHVVSALVLLVLVTLSASIPANAQTFSVVYNFGSVSGEPANPGWNGIVAQGRDGNLYSTTVSGGAHNGGAAFEVSPVGQLRVRYSFCSETNCTDGDAPFSGLTLGLDGNFYGTTEMGGSLNYGAIFKMAPNGTVSVLYNFTNGDDGSDPDAPPIVGTDGNLYGTAKLGGRLGCGTLYKITTSSGAFTLLNGFTSGCNPLGPLVLGTDGNFYGTTSQGGTADGGVVFQFTRTGRVTVLCNLGDANAIEPFGPLVQASDGNFYGTTSQGGTANDGVVFTVTPTGTLTVLHELNGTTDGARPLAGLVQATDGNFYGVAGTGGSSSGYGTLFQVTPGGSYSVLHNFDATTGGSPGANLVQHTNGLLYGGALVGGTGKLCLNGAHDGCGTFYSWNANLPAFVALLPNLGKVGNIIEILGQGFTSASTVSFNGTPAVVAAQGNTGTYLRAQVPSGATTGFVTVTNSSGTLTSNKQFVVSP